MQIFKVFPRMVKQENLLQNVMQKNQQSCLENSVLASLCQARLVNFTPHRKLEMKDPA